MPQMRGAGLVPAPSSLDDLSSLDSDLTIREARFIFQHLGFNGFGGFGGFGGCDVHCDTNSASRPALERGPPVQVAGVVEEGAGVGCLNSAGVT